MGVRGLKTFMEDNPDMMLREYRLYDVTIVIDACNLIGVLLKNSQRHERRDLFGGDMVQFGRHVRRFFDTMKACAIIPILVFDGAQKKDLMLSKTPEKKRRAIERFHNASSIIKTGFGDFILPTAATTAFRSVAVDKGISIVQCMYEADLEVARIANELKCPVMSNDSDFYLIDLPYGLIPIDMFDYFNVNTDLNKQTNPARQYKFIYCNLFKQENLSKYFENFNKSCLPLIAVLAGNDFVKAKVFEKVCSQLPLNRLTQRCNLSTKQFRKTTTKQHEKILKILFYICDKGVNETINQILIKFPREERQSLKLLIKSNLATYEIPREDEFDKELEKLYRKGFFSSHTTYSCDELESCFKEEVNLLITHLKNSTEKDIVSYRCLELAHRNIVFIQPHLEDHRLNSAHHCQIRSFRVMMQLLRSSKMDKRACTIYDRMGDKYIKSIITPLDYLQEHGTLDYLFYDVPKMDEVTRRSIMLATFHCSLERFAWILRYFGDWFDDDHCYEVSTICILFDYIDKETEGFKLWKHFKLSVLICIFYHYLQGSNDTVLLGRLDDNDFHIFVEELTSSIRSRRYAGIPILAGTKRMYNPRIMHQITQMQSSIVAFNFLNGFLGSILIRLRVENWFNSCFIYNFTEAMKNKQISFTKLPSLFEYNSESVLN